MTPLPSTIVSIVILLVGLIALYTMMSVQGRTPKNPHLYTKVHKVTGYLFAVLFLFMFVTMVWRVEDYWEESSARTALHVLLAVVVLFLLTIKILIPRYFKRLSSHLFGLGITIYAMVFSLVCITAGYYIIWKAEYKPYVAYVRGQMMDENLGKQLFITKCSTCHILSEIMRPRGMKDWQDIVNRMIVLDAPRITVDEGDQILYYLSKTHLPKPVPTAATANPVERHCLPCHKITDIYKVKHTRAEWEAILKQMNTYSPETVPKDKINEIVNFLTRKDETPSETQ